MVYYATSLLWLKLIDVKAKQNREALTSEEKSLRKATGEMEFNVLQPTTTYLNQIGQFSDKMGKTTDLNIPPLTVARPQAMGGYHAPEINEETHNLFEEVPSVGIAGDMVMSLCQDAPEPTPNFRIQIPERAVSTLNLTRRIFPVGPRRPEIRHLAGQGITALTFPEFERNT